MDKSRSERKKPFYLRKSSVFWLKITERAGFEPAVHRSVHWFSKPAQSAALPPLRRVPTGLDRSAVCTGPDSTACLSELQAQYRQKRSQSQNHVAVHFNYA